MIRIRSALVLAAHATIAGLAAGATSGPEEFFESEIRPVLAARCVSCHGADRQDGGVRLDSREAVAPLVTAADPSLSLVLRGETSAPATCVLQSRLVETFERWIALDLPWPKRAAKISTAERDELGRRHWAFQPVVDPPVPKTAGGESYANPVDAFVSAARREAGLAPSPLADRRTLARRLSYTLTGLPPRPAETARFEEDPDPRAYERLVDRLLDSESYGEHWARHWLDVARYSDTKGYVYAREEKRWPHAWTYRDWVVRAFNEDLPYDRFLLLQLAADQIGDCRPGDEAAMGFLTVGRRFLGVRDDIIDDRIDVVTRGMLGLTVGCARCHDHIYDPIPAADYYSLHGVFDSSVEKLVLLGEGEGEGDFRKGHAERVAALEETLAERRAETAGRVRGRLADYLKAQTELHLHPAADFGQRRQKSDMIPAFVHAWRDALRAAEERDDPLFAPWHAFAALPEEGFVEAAPAVLELLTASGVGESFPRLATAFATPPQSFDEVVERYAELFEQVDVIIEREKSEGRAKPEEDVEIEALRRILRGPGSPCEVPDGSIADVEAYFDSETKTELWKLNNAIDRGLIEADRAVPAALTLVEREPPVEPRLLHRGNPLQPGETVPRQFLAVLSGGDREPFRRGSGRLELARAIADPANPLTARVVVNRVWARHFGAGLVRTPSDFGTRADLPSHPELLDWLASRLVEDGWSLKALHRRILLSETWRQASSGPSDPEARARTLASDPENRLLWRANPRRLGYEEFRDSMMAASGDLDRSLGGRPVEAFREPYSKRRALYGKVDRQFVPGVLRTFDFANPDLHIPKRSETTVPQQALFFLNDPFVLDRARALSLAAGAEAATPEGRVAALFRRALQREPDGAEMAESLALLGAAPSPAFVETPTGAADWQYGYGAMDEKAGRVLGFTPLPHFTGTAWQGGPKVPDAKLGWVYLDAAGGHPGNDLDHAAVRRWTAPRAMEVEIRSNLSHEPKAGDGIRAFVVSSRAGLLASTALHAGKRELDVETLEIEAGESIDFLVDIGDGLNNDQFLWDIRLADRREDSEAPALAWHSRADFPVDATVPLTPWEQLAQALLCSNEFLFVD